jgi:molybdenum cofactor cytidylyltransferase
VLWGVILAAGESSRMGSPKALLTDADGRIFVARIAAAMIEAGLPRVVVVSGRHHEAIAAAIGDPMRGRMRLVRNPDPSRGQLSSLWTAMDETVDEETEALVVTLVDVPRVAVQTIRTVVDAWRRTGAPIVRPAFGARRGHPVVFDRAVFEALRSAPLTEGARAVLRARHGEIVDGPVDDPGCVVDVDTPAEYAQLLRGDEA